jgi:hypothetical protein
MKDNRITIRCPRKREFFSKLALAGETAQNVLGKAIDNYLTQEEKTMRSFTYFKNGLFVKELGFMEPDWPTGLDAIETIFEPGYVVLTLSVKEIRDALCDGELLGKLDATQDQVESTFESLPDVNDNIRFNEAE